MSTDSSGGESDNETAKQVPMQQFKWNADNEEMLEEILVKHLFDFQAASREFTKIINSQGAVNE